MKKFAKMFSAVALIGSLGVASMSVLADHGDRRDGSHHRHGAKEFRFDKKGPHLQITEAQRNQLAALRDEDAMKALRAEERQARQAFHQAVNAGANDVELQVLAERLGQLHAKKLLQDVKAKRDFESVLTPEQKQQLEERHAKHRERFKERSAPSATL